MLDPAMFYKPLNLNILVKVKFLIWIGTFLLIYASHYTAFGRTTFEFYNENDTNRVLFLENIAFNKLIIDPEKSFADASEALRISDSLHFNYGQARALNLIGNYYLSNGQSIKALSAFVKNVKRFGAAKDDMLVSELASAISDIGWVYYELNDLNYAEHFLKSALKINIKLNKQSGIARDLGRLGKIKLRNGDYDSSLYYLESSVAMNKSCGQILGMMESQTDRAMVYYKKGNFSEAKSILLDLEKWDVEENITSSIWMNHLLGMICYSQNNIQEALIYQHKALKNAKRMNQKSLSIAISKQLAELYRAQGQHSVALAYIDTFKILSKELAKNDIQVRDTNLLSLLQRLRPETEFASIEMNHNNMVYYNSRLISMRNGLVLSLSFSLILGAIIYKAYRDKRRVNRELMQKFKEVRSKNSEIKSKNIEIEAINSTLLEINSSLNRNEFQLKEAQKIAGLGSWEFRISEKKFTCSEYLVNLFFESEIDPAQFSLKRFVGCIHPDDRNAVFKSLKNAIRFGTEEELAFRIVNSMSETKFLQARTVPLFDASGQSILIAGTVLDTTEYKKIEIGLEVAKNNAELANRSKSMFLANMSHEIRTPLNGIIGFTDILLKEAEQKDHEYLNHIRKSSDNLLHILNDILDFNKIEVGKLTIEETNYSIRDMVNESCTPYVLQANEKGLKLQINCSPEIPAFIVGDPHRTRQILINYISNAIKFTKFGIINIDVSVSSMSIPDGNQLQLKFVVSDSGMGVPKEKQDSIFEVFTQADNSTTRKFGGTGLGLAINAQLAILMGGVTGIESPGSLKTDVQPGSDFWFTIKVKRGKEIVPENKNSTNENLLRFENAPRLLVAEDNQINQILIKKVLLSLNCEVVIVENGKLAVELLEKETFDAVLMDIQMPVMDGHQATLFIRQSRNYEIPIIGVSANVFKEDIEKSMMVGMNAHIGKPFTTKDLFDVIKKNVVNRVGDTWA